MGYCVQIFIIYWTNFELNGLVHLPPLNRPIIIECICNQSYLEQWTVKTNNIEKKLVKGNKNGVGTKLNLICLNFFNVHDGSGINDYYLEVLEQGVVLYLKSPVTFRFPNQNKTLAKDALLT